MRVALGDKDPRHEVAGSEAISKLPQEERGSHLPGFNLKQGGVTGEVYRVVWAADSRLRWRMRHGGAPTDLNRGGFLVTSIKP